MVHEVSHLVRSGVLKVTVFHGAGPRWSGLSHFPVITGHGRTHFLSWVVAELLGVVIRSPLWRHRLLLLLQLLYLLLIDELAVVIVEGLVVLGKLSPCCWLSRTLPIFSATADSVMFWTISLLLRRLVLLVLVVVSCSPVHSFPVLPTAGVTELVNVKGTAERFLRALLWLAHRLLLLTWSNVCPRVALQRKVGSVIHSSAHPCLSYAGVEVSNSIGCLSVHPGILQVSLAVRFAMILLLVVHFISSELRRREVLVA